MSFLDPRMAQRLAIYTNKLVPFHGITAFVAEVRQFSLPIAMMQITNNNQWLWRVTQAICFFVQRSVFSWALPAGVRIPSNATFFCSFITSVVSLLFTLTLFWLRSISETVCIVSKDKRASCVVSSRRDTDDGNRWPAAM